ncbi:MAG: DUF3450 domain-containing protein [Veillonellaceae bacterium]|jgi:hypothetical protein|nr:DUF3450 domain-containing protein [Veillonellaceae bacterium]
MYNNSSGLFPTVLFLTVAFIIMGFIASQLIHFKQENDAIQQTAAQLLEENVSLKAKSQEDDAKITQLQNELANEQQLHAQAEALVKALQAEAAKYLADYLAATNQLATMTKQQDALWGQLASVTAERDTLRQQMTTIQQQNVDLLAQSHCVADNASPNAEPPATDATPNLMPKAIPSTAPWKVWASFIGAALFIAVVVVNFSLPHIKKRRQSESNHDKNATRLQPVILTRRPSRYHHNTAIHNSPTKRDPQ